MRLITKLLSLALLSASTITSTFASDSFVVSSNKILSVKYTFDNVIDKDFTRFTKKDLEEIGYYLNDPHVRVNDAYEQQFGKTHLSLISFSSIMNESVIRPLLNKDPRIAGFSPFNLLNYRKKSDMKTVVTHLTPEAMLDILEIDDKEIRATYIKSFEPLDALIEKKLGGKKSYIPIKGYSKDPMMH
ncbi:hypothetical protein JHD48_10430, partial [Sulfurimonas sp. SAG-AH-194-I05]|nr:hypothetical protein [Sulfurimonas sp. SAG-AH-194-I05]